MLPIMCFNLLLNRFCFFFLISELFAGNRGGNPFCRATLVYPIMVLLSHVFDVATYRSGLDMRLRSEVMFLVCPGQRGSPQGSQMNNVIRGIYA